MKSIVEMSDPEILDFLNSYDKGVKAKVLDFRNEYDFSDEALMNILVAVDYLSTSGLNPKAMEMYSHLVKRAEIELGNRLGHLPSIE